MPSLKGSWCRGRKRTGYDIDINAVPTTGNQNQGENAIHSLCQGVDSAPVLIDLDTHDDEIFISTARDFAEAKNNSCQHHRRQNVVDVIDLDSGHSFRAVNNSWKKSTAMSRNIEFLRANMHIEARNSKRLKREKAIHVVPPPPPPKELTFSCPVCIGPFVEETSTKCGHIFCKKCIKKALETQKKCPSCRKKMTMKDTFRVYLPSATTS